MIYTRFNDVVEFLEELQHVDEKPFVRVAFSHRRGNQMYKAMIVAGFLVDDHLVMLECQIGEYVTWNSPEGHEVEEKLKAFRSRLVNKLKSLGVEVRAGRYVVVGDRKH